MEVGLIIVSVSKNAFEVEFVKSLGELKKEDDDEVGFLYFPDGDCNGEEAESAIVRACF